MTATKDYRNTKTVHSYDYESEKTAMRNMAPSKWKSQSLIDLLSKIIASLQRPLQVHLNKLECREKVNFFL